MSATDPNYMIAIGASAGGMEEINSFFDHTPLDGVAYIIVQHLSADFKSRMVELLARHSKLAVKEAENGMPVKTNEVYLIPHDKFMTIADGRLYLKGKENVPGPHLTINTFFNSVAADCGTKAIGIILSGLGTDGTAGIKAIKKAGGTVFARNPETSSFGGMPASAIATGLVDFVMEPAQMPEAIEDFVRQQEQILADTRQDDQFIPAIIQLIKENSPHDFSDYKQSTILRRTKRRAAYNHFESLEKYLDFLKVTPKEMELLAKDFLISVTAFFRDKDAFDSIQNQILPNVISKLAPGKELKMWVAGCATGEEAYSLAILIAEQKGWDLQETVVKIFATDIDSQALQYAAKGVYDEGIIKDVSPERLEKFFAKEGKQYRISPAIRKMVIFAQHDMVKNPPYCNMDLISCRNLLIYMTPVLQKKIYSMMLFGLKMNGYLFLGASENPIPIIDSLQIVHKKWRIYKNIKTKQSLAFETFALPDAMDMRRKAAFSKEDSVKNVNPNLTETMHVQLAELLDYLVVCVDENYEVIKFFGDSTKYLYQENFKTNLLTLLPKMLAVALHTLCSQVIKTGRQASVHGIKTDDIGAAMNINLTVSLLNPGLDVKPKYMVIFQEDRSVASLPEGGTQFDEKTFYDQYTQNLEEELNTANEKLHDAYELLDASNENMQSFNEELISANEEMQSTNEEMQSVNEELHTINADYQLKNRELLELNDDLNNYFRSNVNGQIFVNKDLLLMKFSPGTVKLFNLLETDIGRPLSNISSNIKLDTILEDVIQVIAERIILVKEIETNNGTWYQVRTMPYVQADQQCNGAIITFNDITALKTAQQELDEKNESLQRINTDLDNFAHTASHDLLDPLGVIQLVIEVINQKVKGAELQEYLDIMNSSIRHFSTLIKDIGTFAKMESGMLMAEMVNLDDILTDIEWSLGDKISSSGAIIRKDLSVHQLFFSKKNLRSILYNLISNAIKYRGKEPPLILLQSKQEAHYTVITVTDNGLGIKKSDFDKIFNIYGRIHQQLEGSGIGLYLVKRIMNAAMGSITVFSEPGKGSTFTLHFRKTSG